MERDSLVTALVAFADRSVRPETHRFLQGLSADELQFIAGFLGACVLESGKGHPSVAQLAGKIAGFLQLHPAASEYQSDDRQHKMILLREYLFRTAPEQRSFSAGAGQAS